MGITRVPKYLLRIDIVHVTELLSFCIQYVLETKAHSVRDKNDDVTNRITAEVIGSRIRERDKKNAEYYVGGYYR